MIASESNWTGANPYCTATELSHHLRTSKTTHVVTEKRNLSVVLEAVSNFRISIILFDDILSPQMAPRNRQDSPFVSLSTLMERTQRFTSNKAPHVPVVLMSTSGTTGMPKMAVRTLSSLMLEAEAINDDGFKPYEVRRLFCAPIYHAFSFPLMMIAPLLHGHTSYFMLRFGEDFYENVEKYEITETALATPAIKKILDARKPQQSALNCLRLLWYGGALLADENHSKILALLPHLEIVPVWGMTEGGWFSTLRLGRNGAANAQVKAKDREVRNANNRSGFVGGMIRGLEGRVMPLHNDISDISSAGEIEVRGPQLMKCYLDDVEASACIWNKEWMKTGDIGLIRRGEVFITGRVKDMIKVNAFQVAPAELENTLLKHSLVQDCTVVRCQQSEHPLVYIVLACTNILDRGGLTDDLRSHMLLHLSKYKVQACVFEFLQELPRGDSGKVLRKLLPQAKHKC